MKTETFTDLLRTAKICGDYNYMVLYIQTPDSPTAELIINPRENFSAKLEYLQKAYNDSLELKANTAIKIVGYHFVNSLEEIRWGKL